MAHTTLLHMESYGDAWTMSHRITGNQVLSILLKWEAQKSYGPKNLCKKHRCIDKYKAGYPSTIFNVYESDTWSQETADHDSIGLENRSGRLPTFSTELVVKTRPFRAPDSPSFFWQICMFGMKEDSLKLDHPVKQYSLLANYSSIIHRFL